MTHHFVSSVLKTDKDGNYVLSDHLEEGETLANGTTYEQVTSGDYSPRRDQPFRSVPPLEPSEDTGYKLSLDPTGVHTVLKDADDNIVTRQAETLEPAAEGGPDVIATAEGSDPDTKAEKVTKSKDAPEA